MVATSAEGTAGAIAVDELALFERLVMTGSHDHEVRLGLPSEAVGSLARFSFLSSALLLDVLESLVVALDLREGLAALNLVGVLKTLLDFLIS